MTDLFGQDIKLDANGQAAVAANGELLLTEGVETGVQDVRLRLGASSDGLFYDAEFVSRLCQWVKDENTQANRIGFEMEAERCIQADPRVVAGSAQCAVLSWNELGLTARVQWEFVGEDHPFNLIVGIDAEKQEMVIKDVNPRPGS